MTIKSSIIAAVCAGIALSACSSAPEGEIFIPAVKQAAVQIDTRITPDMLTLDEKISLLSCNMGIERLGVPISFYSEGMHGIAYGGPSNWGQYKPLPTTSFPQAYGLGATWDPELLERVATQISIEQRYYFQNPVYDRAGLVMWGPNVDLNRDPRWGRGPETYGEDPWLISQLAIGFVRGAQGPDPDHWRSASVLKHFMANSYENERHSDSSDMSERLLREYYGYTFYKVVTDGGARGIMTSYNAVNGKPMTASPLIRDLMIDEWGNDGIICSDQDAMMRMVTVHKAYPDFAHSAAAGIKAGITQYLSDEKEDSQQAIRDAYSQGLIDEADLDQAVQRNLNIEQKLGLLGGEDPYAGIGRDGSPVPCYDPAAVALCREVTAKSAVLLKNNGILPLNARAYRKVAVIGPRVDTVMQDWYGGNPPHRVSILDGVREALGPDVEVAYETVDFSGRGIALAEESDLVILVLNDNPAPCLDINGKNPEVGWGTSQVISDGMEAVDRQSLTLAQEDIGKMILKANPNTVMVLTCAFPYAIRWSQDNMPAILQVTHGSEELGHGVADVLFGKVNPAGRLTQTWPESITDLPPIPDYDITKGRTYMYAKARPLYPFGHGLSYTTFKYSRLSVSDMEGGVVNVSVDVTNTGDMDGDEVVQLYVQYPDSKVLRPERQLRGFKRVHIPSGETVTVSFCVEAEDLAWWDEERHGWVMERGRVRFLAGASSSDIRLERVARI